MILGSIGKPMKKALSSKHQHTLSPLADKVRKGLEKLNEKTAEYQKWLKDGNLSAQSTR